MFIIIYGLKIQSKKFTRNSWVTVYQHSVKNLPETANEFRRKTLIKNYKKYVKTPSKPINCWGNTELTDRKRHWLRTYSMRPEPIK